MYKKDLIYELDELKREYITLETAQKVYDNETDQRLKEYRQKNNLSWDYIPNKKEWSENIGSYIYPEWYQNADKKKKELFETVCNKIGVITGEKVETFEFYQKRRLFQGWYKMPFVK